MARNSSFLPNLTFWQKESELYFLSTAKEDTQNYTSHKNVFAYDVIGSGKNYQNGRKIWLSHLDKIKNDLSLIKNDKVIIFAAAGGGSGSSGLPIISETLEKNGNKLIAVTVLPYKKENVPPGSNAIQSLNDLKKVNKKANVLIFSNEILLKKNNGIMSQANDEIITKTNLLINILDRYNSEFYSPITVDKAELDSVLFPDKQTGFIGITDDVDFEEGKIAKFEFGKLNPKTTKHIAIYMIIDPSFPKDVVDTYYDQFRLYLEKYSRFKSARIIPGILRINKQRVNEISFIVIGNGLDIESEFNKLKEIAKDRATSFIETVEQNVNLDKDESNLLNI